MDHTELLFAAAVRDLASAMRAAEKGKYTSTLNAQPDSKSAAIDKWQEENPIGNYIPKALSEIKAIAATIRLLQ